MMDYKPTIWIINEAGHPYYKALDIIPEGTLRPFTTGNINPFALDRLSSDIARGVVKYVRPEDYALIAGTPILNALVISLWLFHHGKCKLLQWNAKEKAYVEGEITRENLGNLLEKEMLR